MANTREDSRLTRGDTIKIIKCKRCGITFSVSNSIPRRELCTNCQVEKMEEYAARTRKKTTELNKKCNYLMNEIIKCIEFTEWEPKINKKRLFEILKPLISRN